MPATTDQNGSSQPDHVITITDEGEEEDQVGLVDRSHSESCDGLGELGKKEMKFLKSPKTAKSKRISIALDQDWVSMCCASRCLVITRVYGCFGMLSIYATVLNVLFGCHS